jgi:hypothetical protein
MYRFKYMLSDHYEDIVRCRSFQFVSLIVVFLRFFFFKYLMRNTYKAYQATLGYERIYSSVAGCKLLSCISRINTKMVLEFNPGRYPSDLLESYLQQIEVNSYREDFSSYGKNFQVRLKYPKEHDSLSRQGDLLILKPYLGGNEKGVILLQYNDAFRKFLCLFNVKLVAQHYRIVLEPSWWGYRDLSILLFTNIGTDVIVQAQYLPDFEYIKSLNSNLTPIRIGAGDWIDSDIFSECPYTDKVYDIVMIANWQRIKRHELLFSAISQCKHTVKKVALIGYPYVGRTKDDIFYEASKYNVKEKLDIYESISRKQVGEIVRQSRSAVMLSLREGANRGIYECFFSGVPVVISNRNVGVNRDHINKYTGLTSDDKVLPENIDFLLENEHDFTPREWALRNTGCANSNRSLNEFLKNIAMDCGEEWTKDLFQKKNDTNSTYVHLDEQLEADMAISHLYSFLV